MSSFGEIGFTLLEWTGSILHGAMDCLVSKPSIGHTFETRKKQRKMKRKMFYRRLRKTVGLPELGKRKRGADSLGSAKRQRSNSVQGGELDTTEETAMEATTDPKVAELQAELAKLRAEMAKFAGVPEPDQKAPSPPASPGAALNEMMASLEASTAASSSGAPPAPPPPPVAPAQLPSTPTKAIIGKSGRRPLTPRTQSVRRTALSSRGLSCDDIANQRMQLKKVDAAACQANRENRMNQMVCPQDMIANALQRKFKNLPRSPPSAGKKEQEDDDEWDETPATIRVRNSPAPMINSVSYPGSTIQESKAY